AEDGIRDFHVTGVQTCALPICPSEIAAKTAAPPGPMMKAMAWALPATPKAVPRRARLTLPAISVLVVGTMAERTAATRRKPRVRSEERRVGKECRGRV